MFKNAKRLLLPLLLLFTKISEGQLCQGTTVVLLETSKYYETVNWNLEFDEEFNTIALDTTTWELIQWRQGTSDGKGIYATLNNVEVSPSEFYGEHTSATGVASIIIKKEDVTRLPVSWNPSIPAVTYHYTGSCINTRQQFGWGKYEIRCKIPKGKGIWSAFWMYSEKKGEGHEIDVFEFANGNSLFKEYDPKRQCKDVMMNCHSADNTRPQRLDWDCPYTYKSDIDYSLDYHIFSVIWNKFECSWYIDNECIKSTYQWYDVSGAPITPYNIKPNQVAIRNDWFPKNQMSIIVGNDVEKSKGTPDETTPFPNSYLIDYIRYYSY